MNKITCIECNLEFESNLEECPNCACPIEVISKSINLNRNKIINTVIQSQAKEQYILKDSQEKVEQYSIILKVFMIFILWAIGGLIISLIFGDGLIGTVVQMVCQIYGTVYILKLPGKKGR